MGWIYVTNASLPGAGALLTLCVRLKIPLLDQASDLQQIWPYRPFSKDNRLVRPASPPSLNIASQHPRLEGAIAFFPVYAAFAQAVYAGLDEKTVLKFVDCANIGDGYRHLADGMVDIFFGVAPSREQREYAAAKGHTLTETPICREAFVFVAHNDNPVRSLTQAQIRGVYSGRIRNWKELGGPDEDILAFQQPEGSGCQTTMLRIMKEVAMARPNLRKQPQQDAYGDDTDTVLRAVVSHNCKNGIGYSFRWYARVLFDKPGIRLLAIDDIVPTPENIESGAYPFRAYGGGNSPAAQPPEQEPA